MENRTVRLPTLPNICIEQVGHRGVSVDEQLDMILNYLHTSVGSIVCVALIERLLAYEPEMHSVLSGRLSAIMRSASKRENQRRANKL